jgi:hypothetical protein
MSNQLKHNQLKHSSYRCSQNHRRYLILVAVAQLLDTIFWWRGFPELAPENGSTNWAGYMVITAHFTNLFLKVFVRRIDGVSEPMYKDSGPNLASDIEGTAEGKKTEGKKTEGKNLDGNQSQHSICSSRERNAHLGRDSALVARDTCSLRESRCFSKRRGHLRTTFDLCLRIGMWRA